MDALSRRVESNQSKNDTNAAEHHSVELGIKWTLPRLQAACRRLNIFCEETTELESLRGFVVTYGRTSMIGIKQALSEQDKIWTIAHELGHVALGHIHDDAHNGAGYLLELEVIPTETMILRDKAEEREAHIWAAHLLVRPEVFAEYLTKARANLRDEGSALEEAKRQTANSLNVPVQLVDFWYWHRDHRFQVAPHDWITR